MSIGKDPRTWDMRHLLMYLKQHGMIGGLKAAARVLRGRVAVRSDPSLYAKWTLQREPSAEGLALMRTRSTAFQYQPLVSVVTPVYNTDARGSAPASSPSGTRHILAGSSVWRTMD